MPVDRVKELFFLWNYHSLKKKKKRGAEMGEKYGTIALEQSEQISGPL